jgi:hypothetical protein
MNGADVEDNYEENYSYGFMMRMKFPRVKKIRVSLELSAGHRVFGTITVAGLITSLNLSSCEQVSDAGYQNLVAGWSLPPGGSAWRLSPLTTLPWVAINK